MTQITIIDRRTDKVLDDIQMDDFWDELRTRDLNGLDIFDFVTFADKVFSQYLQGERGIIIPAREGGYAEFIIKENKQTRDRNRYIFSEGSFLEIAKKKIIEPGTYTGTPQQLVNMTMNGIAKWKIGNVAYATIRTIQVEERITAYQMLKRIAGAFEYELKFRIENTNGIILRYVDLVEKIGAYRGHEIELGHNLESIERHENTRDIVTALNVYGPPDEVGNRLHVFVYDNEALERWSTDGEHLVEDYYPETLDQDITDERLITLGENELEKRVNALVSYTAKMVDIGEDVHFGDEVKVKDEKFNPPLYLEGRIHTLREDLKGIVPADVDFGDFVELSVEDAFANYRKLQEEMQNKIKQAELRAAIGDIKYTIISYVEPLNVEKSSIDSRFDSLNNNLDLSDTIRSSLVTAKTNYNNAYNVLMNTINTKKALDKLIDSDLQEVNSQYASYDIELANLTDQFELATNDIAQKKANDAEGKAKKHTDDSLSPINQALEKAQGDIDQAVIDLGTAKTDIENAQTTIDTALTDLGDLETALGNVESDLGNKIDASVYNSKVQELTNDIASKVDGEWVNGRLQVAIDEIEVGGRNLVPKSNEFNTGSPGPGITPSLTEEGYLQVFSTSNNGNYLAGWAPSVTGVEVSFSEGDLFTVSFTMKSPDHTKVPNIYIKQGMGYFPLSGTMGGEFSTFYYTGKWKKDNRISPHLGFSHVVGTTIIKNWKIEKGNKATDWSPAPEDIFADIDTKADADNVYIKADIDGMFDNVVSITAYQTDQQGIVERFESAESRLTQNESEILARVTKTTYDALEGRVQTAEGRIEVMPEEINLAVTQGIADLDIGGRNLLIGTSSTVQSINVGGWGDIGYVNNGTSDLLESGVVEIGGTYTFRVKLETGEYPVRCFIRIPNATSQYRDFRGNSVPENTIGYSEVTVTIPNDALNVRVYYIRFDQNPTPTHTVKFSEIKLEKGNKATDWTPAPEDQVGINEVITAINLSTEGVRIQGKNITLDGDTLVTGTIGASAAVFLNMTTRDMTAINATMQNSTVTGNLTATNATFLNGTFDKATIIDATIQDATISGNMIAGIISSSTKIDVTTDLFVGNNIYLGNDDLVGRKVIDFFNGRSFISSDYINIGGQVRNRIAIAAEGTRGFVTIAGSDIELIGTNVISFTGQSSTASIDITGGLARWRQSAENYIRQGTDGTIDFYKESSLLARFTTMETAKHGFIRMGGIGLKFLNSGDSFQVRNAADTDYAPLRASTVTEMSSEKYKTNILLYKDSALDLINNSMIYEYIKGGKPEIGLIIERETPIEVVDGDGVRPLIMGSLAWKAIQELDEKTNKRITDLVVENQMLKERVRLLEVKVA